MNLFMWVAASALHFCTVVHIYKDALRCATVS
jgi:hypothetical protein